MTKEIKDALNDRIWQEYLFYCSNLVGNSCFLISKSHEYHMWLRGCLHEILFRAKWNIFISVSGQFLITVYMIQPEMKLVAGVISLRSFWQKWNFISGDKISCKHYPKWNHMKGNICTCVSKNDWLLLNGTFISGYPDKISFRPQWKVMQAEFLLWWFEILLPVDFISGLM